MCKAVHTSDLHGKKEIYGKLFTYIKNEVPDIVFLGGDLYPSFRDMQNQNDDFFEDFLVPNFTNLKQELKDKYPIICIILGNDDPAPEEKKFKKPEYCNLWNYINCGKLKYKKYTIYGYSYIPPTPFLYKDWELYDVSRYVDPGCVHPTEGIRSIDPGRDIDFASIKKDLEDLTANQNLENAIFLFHSPPYKTNLDRAALDNKFVDYIPLDVNVGSIAIKELIESRQPLLTLHGHIHESTTLTGHWKEIIGKTYCFNAATELKALSIIEFDLDNFNNAIRKIY
ncbi:MAG TPA: metallophosphoesterase [Bacteroidales bacterium]|nr:metallophosphoesterase [Bacteroidales bacterium]